MAAAGIITATLTLPDEPSTGTVVLIAGPVTASAEQAPSVRPVQAPQPGRPTA